MANSGEWKNMSVIEAIRLIKDQKMLLPIIQREYVWDRKDIISLFESIIDEFPVGSFVIWKTNEEVLRKTKPLLFEFSNDISRQEKDGKSAAAKELMLRSYKKGDYYIVLDGQQRITSYYIALTGVYRTQSKKGQHKQNYQAYRLYYNLDYYNGSFEESDTVKRFSFLTDEDYYEQEQSWYPVQELFPIDDEDELDDELSARNVRKESKKELKKLYRRLNSKNTSDTLIHYFCIEEAEYDKTLNVFLRVNSTGKPLSKTDLLFSTLKNYWPEGKAEIEGLVNSLNTRKDGAEVFDFSNDFIMRTSLILADKDPGLKIEAFDKTTVNNIKNNWKKMKTAFTKTQKLLLELGYQDDTIISYNAIIPIVYYFYKRGKNITSSGKEKIKEYLSVATANRVFGASGNTVLSGIKTAMDENLEYKTEDFSIDILKKNSSIGDKFIVTEEIIDQWLDRLRIGSGAYPLLTLLQSDINFAQSGFDQDHLHPKSAFDDGNAISKLGLSEDEIKEWRRKRDLIPNLWLCVDTKNRGDKNKIGRAHV